MIRVCLKPPRHFRNGLRYREALEDCARRNDCPVKFFGMLDGVGVEGEQGHVERFLACVGVLMEEVRG